MLLRIKMAIFDWEWGRNSAPREGQKMPWEVKTHSLTVWQRQWDISDKGRFLHQLKPKVTTKTLLDFPNRTMYSQIAQL